MRIMCRNLRFRDCSQNCPKNNYLIHKGRAHIMIHIYQLHGPLWESPVADAWGTLFGCLRRDHVGQTGKEIQLLLFEKRVYDLVKSPRFEFQQGRSDFPSSCPRWCQLIWYPSIHLWISNESTSSTYTPSLHGLEHRSKFSRHFKSGNNPLHWIQAYAGEISTLCQAEAPPPKKAFVSEYTICWFLKGTSIFRRRFQQKERWFSSGNVLGICLHLLKMRIRLWGSLAIYCNVSIRNHDRSVFGNLWLSFSFFLGSGSSLNCGMEQVDSDFKQRVAEPQRLVDAAQVPDYPGTNRRAEVRVRPKWDGLNLQRQFKELFKLVDLGVSAWNATRMDRYSQIPKRKKKHSKLKTNNKAVLGVNVLQKRCLRMLSHGHLKPVTLRAWYYSAFQWPCQDCRWEYRIPK